MPLLPRKKTLNDFSINFAILTLFFIALCKIPTVFAIEIKENIALSALGDFEIKFSKIEKESLIVGQNLIGEVTYKVGENYSVLLPFDIQKITYRIKNGNYVELGDTIATVEGYDAHHFIDEYQSAKIILEASENHFQMNKVYFENKTIQSSQWLEITKSYLEAKLNFEHFQHQMSFLHIDENEKFTLISPHNGIVKIPSYQSLKSKGDIAFDVINTDSVKVKIRTPLSYAAKLSHFVVSSTCQLEVNSVESIVDKYHQTIWASPTSDQCQLTLGQSIKLSPILKFDGYKVPKSSIFELNDKDYIAIKFEDKLSLIPVFIVGATQKEYYVSASEDISKTKVLVRSVSILQGKLLALGLE
ncbi:RND family efflux transporter [Colwellia psychrerythraea]|uniref:RND efflux pump membrane fusion protein barrel-sandwich domain-containing protein n=1 Tax=Colwellia psychrerythraea TaxID=28229 RepID=A0A099KA20_COLPS|nr:hypothetical protein [Colwellia psychrerythraea]KGJ87559.1 hypothetical protein ND2E_4297 [Colwellia psychrerythraea]